MGALYAPNCTLDELAEVRSTFEVTDDGFGALILNAVLRRAGEDAGVHP